MRRRRKEEKRRWLTGVVRERLRWLGVLWLKQSTQPAVFLVWLTESQSDHERVVTASGFLLLVLLMSCQPVRSMSSTFLPEGSQSRSLPSPPPRTLLCPSTLPFSFSPSLIETEPRALDMLGKKSLLGCPQFPFSFLF